MSISLSKKLANRRAVIKTRARMSMIGGILNKECPKAIEAAGEAYLIWYRHLTEYDLKDYLLNVGVGSVSPPTFYLRFARLCKRVLEDGDVPEDLIENLHYAWGYFEALRRAYTPQF